MDERQQTSRPSRSLAVNLDTDIKPDATPTIFAMRAADAGSIETLGSRWMRRLEARQVHGSLIFWHLDRIRASGRMTHRRRRQSGAIVTHPAFQTRRTIDRLNTLLQTDRLVACGACNH